MAWFKCIGTGGGGGSQGGLSDLYVNPYNVENGSYTISGNTIEYTVSAQTGYEGMSVQLLGLEVGHQYLISFDAELMNAPTSWAGSYSWKTCIADGNITDYGAGDYGRDTLSEGQYELPTTASKKSYGFLVTPQSAMTTLLFLTARASSGQTVVFNINNFKMADLSGEVENHIINTVQLLDSYSRGSNDAVTSVTSKSFNVKANNTVMIAIMHRASVTVPSGFNLIKESQVLSGSQSIAVYSKYFTSDYTGTFAVTNSDSSKRISVFVFQFNSKIKIEEWFEDYYDNEVPSGGITYTLNLIKKPMLLLCHNVYADTVTTQLNWVMQDNELKTKTDDNVNANVWLNNWDELNVKLNGRMDAFLNLDGNTEVSNSLSCIQNYNGVLGLALTDELYNSGGLGAPTKFWQGLQSQYDALVSHESDRMYIIVATINQMSDTMSGYINKTSKIYIGDTLVYPVEEQGYDWCITDYYLPNSNESTNGDNRDYDMNVGVYFQSDANKNRDWQIEFKATLSTGSYSSGDQVIFGQGNNSSARLKEVYFNTRGDLYISGNGISDINYISGANGHDIKMIYSNADGTIELYEDETLVNTITGVPTSYSAANYELGLCRYKSNYRFHGTINYFKFKWLS